MFISFTKYVSSTPGVTYQGFDGLNEILIKNNQDGNGGTIVPPQFYNQQLYSELVTAMQEFKEKPNGIVSYLAKTNNVDTTYTITFFNSMEDFVSIAQTSWFENYAAKRAAYLTLVGISTFQKSIDGRVSHQLSLETTFSDLDSEWNMTDVMIA